MYILLFSQQTLFICIGFIKKERSVDRAVSPDPSSTSNVYGR